MRKLYYLIKNLFRIASMLDVDDSGNLRFCTVSSLGKSQKSMLFSQYGIMHNPPPNSLALIWTQQGQESNSVAMADDPNNRPLKNLAPGEFAIGNYLTGDYAYFKEDGTLEIKTTGNLIANVGGDLNANVSGDINASAGGAMTATASGKATLDSTTEIELIAPIIKLTGTLTNNGTNMGDTHIHGGVQPGTGNTAGPM